jgi:hypothetical protein
MNPAKRKKGKGGKEKKAEREPVSGTCGEVFIEAISAFLDFT